jgi:hypothetical protein
MKQVIDSSGCGGLCQGRHELILLVRTAEED